MKKILLLSLFVTVQAFGQGLKLSTPDEKAMFPKLPADKLGFAELLPFSYSLEKYVPPVLRQKGGTCVGFATFYYALSTMYNIEFDITDTRGKYVHAFDPYYIYSIVNNNKEDCEGALPFDDAFKALSKIGAKKLFYPPFTDCGTEWTETELKNTLGYTVPYSIEEWYYLEKTSKPADKLIEIVKNFIYNKIPVITGFKYVKSMSSYNSENQFGVKGDGLWDPKSLEDQQGGHALCVVGYNDYKHGGAFRIVNSWGKDYGDDGYIWVKYDDFVEFVELLFVVELNGNLEYLPPTVIDEDKYKRFRYENYKNTYSFFEGQYLNKGVNGYGILSDKASDSYYVGMFNDANMEGFFLVLDEEGLFSANAVNGKLQDFEKLGFAANNELMDTQLDAKKYFSKLGTKLSIRKANSTSNSPSKPKK